MGSCIPFITASAYDDDDMSFDVSFDVDVGSVMDSLLVLIVPPLIF